MSEFVFEGVIPASLMPFHSNLEIDEKNYRKHLNFLLDTEGVTAVTINGHAAEVASLTLEEQKRSLNIAVEENDGKKQIICGVYEGGSQKAAEIAKMAEAEGADGLLIFPSEVFDFGSQGRPEMYLNHYETIAQATDLPMIAFVYPVNNGLHIPTDALIELCDTIDNIVAVKDISSDISVYENNYRGLKALDKNVSMLTSFSKSLLPTLAIGADGILSGFGSVIPDLHVQLFNAIKRNDLEKAREVEDILYPLNQVIYGNPFLDMHNRMKMASKLLNRIDEAFIRPPFQPLSEQEVKNIKEVLNKVGIKK